MLGVVDIYTISVLEFSEAEKKIFYYNEKIQCVRSTTKITKIENL